METWDERLKSDSITETLEYRRGYINGYKEGVQAGIKQFIKHHKLDTDVKMVININDHEAMQKIINDFKPK